MSPTQVLIYARYPRPGSVKTRLIGALTPEQAAGVHCASLATVIELVASLDGFAITLVVTPDDQVATAAHWAGEGFHDCRPQGDGDLGARLTRTTKRAFDEGAERVILLGADSPTLPPDHLHQAVALLTHADVVLGSSDDGGYCLLGLRRFIPELFQHIDWGGPEVAAQTRQRARDAGAVLRELPPWYDLDRREDLPRALADLGSPDPEARPAACALKKLISDILRTDEL